MSKMEKGRSKVTNTPTGFSQEDLVPTVFQSDDDTKIPGVDIPIPIIEPLENDSDE